MQVDELPLMMTYDQVAEALQVSRSYVVKMAGNGTLPVVRIGRSVRVRRDQFLEFIETNSTKES